MEKRSRYLAPINLEQREIHFKKEAGYEGADQYDTWKPVMQKLMADLYNEVNILRTELNKRENPVMDVVIPTIYAFVNQGESILVQGIGSAMEPPESFDVVVLPDVSTLQAEYPKLVRDALRVARKRVIVGYYATGLKNEFEAYLDTLGYMWLRSEEAYEHYIIDKSPQLLQDGAKETKNGISEI